MRSPVFKNFMLKLLVAETMPSSSIPMTVKGSGDWQNWLAAGFIEAERRGTSLSFRVTDRETLRGIFHQKFPGEAEGDGSAVDNLRAFADSKARARASQGVCFLRGWQRVRVNEVDVDLGEATQRFGLFAAVLSDLKAERICLVENLDSFRQAEKVFGTDWLFLHTYGRVGKEWLQKISCREMLVFSDYDFVGLEEFLRVREAFPEAQFFMPEQYEALWVKYAKPLKNRDGGEQLATRRVSESQYPVVVALREQLLRTGKFLEQQALFL
jgi:hypothetical protein